MVLLLVSGLLYLNRRLSQQIWTPFQKTLASLKKFQLNQQQLPAFTKSDIKEFQELNTAIETMVEHSISVYKTQKEFTENASHELQTPLAILKNKLDLLLQSEGLTEQQYQLAEEMNGALLRSTRINKNLLLLAKIENNQFDSSEKVSIDTILLQSLDTLKEYMDQKNIGLVQHIVFPVDKNASSGLTELLCNNLLLNAIRNTREGAKFPYYWTISSLKFPIPGSRHWIQNSYSPDFQASPNLPEEPDLDSPLFRKSANFSNGRSNMNSGMAAIIFGSDLAIQHFFKIESVLCSK